MTQYMACICGWVSEPYPDDYKFMSLGGILDCPICHAAFQNATLEGCYGHVDVITLKELLDLRDQIERGIAWEQAFRNLQRHKLGLDKPVLLTTPFYTTGETNDTGPLHKHIDLEKTEDKIRKLKRKSIRIQGKYKGRGKTKRREP